MVGVLTFPKIKPSLFVKALNSFPKKNRLILKVIRFFQTVHICTMQKTVIYIFHNNRTHFIIQLENAGNEYIPQLSLLKHMEQLIYM